MKKEPLINLINFDLFLSRQTLQQSLFFVYVQCALNRSQLSLNNTKKGNLAQQNSDVHRTYLLARVLSTIEL